MTTDQFVVALLLSKLDDPDLGARFRDFHEIVGINIPTKSKTNVNESIECSYAAHLLDRLKMPKDSFTVEYLQNLDRHCYSFVQLALEIAMRNKKNGILVYPEDLSIDISIEKGKPFLYSPLDIINLLELECKIKSEKHYVMLESSEAISATDISNFTYCPVSWSISKNFRLPKLESARIGSHLHDRHFLTRFLREKQGMDNIRGLEIYCNPGAKELFAELKYSDAVFIGNPQTETARKFFTGNDGRYTGQPDYIFLNKMTKKHFAVEEKFQLIPSAPRLDLPRSWCESRGYNPEAIQEKRMSFYFHENHLNQIYSYVYGIKDYGSLYGYLIYWRYFIDRQGIWIEQAIARKISGSNKIEKDALIRVYNAIKRVMHKGKGEFKKSMRSPSRCAGCVNCLLCGHKTGLFSEFSYPYSDKYMTTKW